MVAARVRARSLTGAPSAPRSCLYRSRAASFLTSHERRAEGEAEAVQLRDFSNGPQPRPPHRYRIAIGSDDDRRITQPNNTRTPGRGQPSRRYHGARHGAHLLFTLSPHEDRTVFFMHLLPSLAPAFRKAVPALGQLIRFLTAIPHPPLWQWTAILLPAARKQHEAS